jgi:hypothetical protein
VLRTQLVTAAPTSPATLPTYQMAVPTLSTDCLPTGLTATNLPAVAAVQQVCNELIMAQQQLLTSQQAFSTGMQTFSQQFAQLAVPANATTVGLLEQSLKVRVLQAQQKDLIARHMANLATVERTLRMAERKLTSARSKFMLGAI